MKRYKNISLDYGVNEEFMREYERYQEEAALAEEEEPEDTAGDIIEMGAEPQDLEPDEIEGVVLVDETPEIVEFE